MSLLYEGSDIEDFIFGEGKYYNEDVSEYIAGLDAAGIMECCDEDTEVAGYRIAMEAEQNFSKIMTALAAQEIATLESTGEAVVYEAGKLREVGSKLKKFIDTAWAKISGLFKRAVDWISKFVLSNKSFVKRFEGRKDLKTPTKEFKGYDYSNARTKLELAKDIEKTIKTTYYRAKSDSKINTENLEKDIRKAIVSLIGGSTSGESSDFSSDVHKAFRGGAEEKKAISLTGDSYSYAACLSTISDGKKHKGYVKKLYDKTKSTVATMKKEVDAELVMAEKDSDGEKTLTAVSKYVNSCIRMITVVSGAHTRAIQNDINQCKAIVVFFNANQPKKEEKTNESAFDFLSGVDFI